MAKKTRAAMKTTAKPSTPKRKLDLAPPALVMGKEELHSLNNVLAELQSLKTDHSKAVTEFNIAQAERLLKQAQLEKATHSEHDAQKTITILANQFEYFKKRKETVVAEICEKTGIVLQEFTYNNETGEITPAP